jgi:hypothetical protein
MKARPLRVWTLALALSTTGACARRVPAPPLDPVALATAGPSETGAPLSFEEAARRAVAEGPELLSLRKAIEGVNLRPMREPIEVSAGRDADGRAEAGLVFDALSLLGLGRIQGERCLARARRDEATIAWHARAREVVGEVAEAFAVDAALAEGPPAPVLLDSEAFVKAGLAPAASTRAVEAARTSLAADVAAREAERRLQRLRVGRLLGRRPEHAPGLLASPAPWPEVPAPDAARLLVVDPAVQRKLAAHEVARGELARAHAGRYPRLLVNPAVAFNPAYFFGAVALELPVGAGAEVRAAIARVESARLAVRAAVLEALERAEAAAEEWRAATALDRAARTRFEATVALADAEKARVETEGEGFAEAVLAANGVVDAARDVREASAAAARARVRAAFAAGWPAPAFGGPLPEGR